jgi:hypothetical protein
MLRRTQGGIRTPELKWGLRLVLGALISFASAIAHGQASPANPNPTPLVTPAPPPVFPNSKAPDYSPASPRTLTFEDMQYRRYLQFRLKSMTADAAKLLKLAQELNKKVEANGVGSLSDDDIRKLTQIEKLAKEVKSKMELATSGNRPD